MTNEEASCVLHCPDAYGGIYGQKYGEALAHCFELLKQEPCEDAISRKDFIAKIEDIYDGYMLDEGGCYPQNFVDLAEEMPSVKPQYTEAEIQNMQEMEQAEIEKAYELGKAEQPKMGHWKRVSADKYVQHATYYFRCSECDNDIIGEHNYCPHCGAKMEEEQDAH